MKNRSTLYAAMAVVGAFVVSAGAQAQDQNTTTTTTVTQSTTAMPENDHLSVGDRIFLMDLVHANAKEIELSRVAYHQANSPAISEYARHMLLDHRALQDQLVSTYGGRIFMRNWEGVVSQSSNPEPEDWLGGPAEGTKPNYNNWSYLFPDDWAQVHQLKNLDGRALDEMYVQDMAADHAMLLDEINRRDAVTDNSDIKALISSVRPTVEHHLDRARTWKFDYNGMNKFFYLD